VFPYIPAGLDIAGRANVKTEKPTIQAGGHFKEFPYHLPKLDIPERKINVG